MRISTTVLAAALAIPLAAQDQLAEGWDFVPGEKILLYDDFTDMTRGGAPPHWKVRGGSVKLGANGRLTAPQSTELHPNVAKWPKNFTVDHEVSFDKGTEEDERKVSWQFGQDDDWVWSVSLFLRDGDEFCEVQVDTDEERLASPQCPVKIGQTAKLAIWLQEGRLRVYLNNDRLVDMNQLKFKSWSWVRMETSNSTAPVTLANFRIAESTPDLSKTMFATGRYVTHGIQFDVNSDRLRPESAPVLKQIADALQQQPALKVRIEGHTDSSGDAAKNLDLSRRRAAAVKDALAKQFGIAADRLTAEGYGSTKPLSGNETPQGRAENRRVELVKI
jgi:outer membrane protein OmpA-like peptidoglycan-associated protein